MFVHWLTESECGKLPPLNLDTSNEACYNCLSFCYSGVCCHFVTVVSIVWFQWCLVFVVVTMVFVIRLLQWCLVFCFVTVVPIVILLQWCLLSFCYSGVCCCLVQCVCCFVTVVSVVVWYSVCVVLLQWCVLFCYSGVCCCFVTVVSVVVLL